MLVDLDGFGYLVQLSYFGLLDFNYFVLVSLGWLGCVKKNFGHAKVNNCDLKLIARMICNSLIPWDLLWVCSVTLCSRIWP